MKNTETDREISDLIKETLDGYEEQYILGSWEEFVRRRKRKRKLAIWFSTTGIAASLLAFWLLYTIFFQGSVIRPTGDRSTNVASSGIQSVNPGENRNEPYRADKVPSSSSTADRTVLSHHEKYSQVAEAYEPPVLPVAGKKPGGREEAGVKDTLKQSGESNSDIRHLTAGAPETYSKNIITEEKSEHKYSGNSGKMRADSSLTGSRNTNDFTKPEPDNDLTKSTYRRKIRLGISLAPGFTNSGTTSALSYSGGLIAEYSVSDRFIISTGMQFEHQSVDDESTDHPDWMPADKSKAELVDLDLPLNITWKLRTGKSTAYYLSAGVSSLLYLSEKYISTTYTQKMLQAIEIKDGIPNVTYQLETVSSTQEEKEQAFSTFDLAGRINIIIGVEQKLSKNLFLRVEPFLKVPVTELASRNLRFTTSGISCRLSF